jgi:hydrogenase small subunit
MLVSRRDFLHYCSTAAAALGLSRFDLTCLADTLDDPNAPTVLWLQGSGCTGCSISFLNHIAGTAPHNAGEVLIDVINLAYHPNLMAAAGQTAVDAAQQAYAAGNYVLVVEGGIPTAFAGNACWAWTDNGVDVTFQEAVVQLAERAAAIICVGQCASWGGMWAAPPNPTQVRGVSEVTGLATINVAGCPPHPDWLVWVIARYLAGQPINLDAYGRPATLFGRRIHSICPLRGTNEATRFGQEGRCLEELGCRGEDTRGECPSQLFNGGVNWCIGAGAPCFGCTEPSFPGTRAFFDHD